MAAAREAAPAPEESYATHFHHSTGQLAATR
jgi:hypothetical protein